MKNKVLITNQTLITHDRLIIKSREMIKLWKIHDIRPKKFM